MPLVSQRNKQTDLESTIQTAAERHVSGIKTDTHARIFAENDSVSRHDLERVMGDPFYYAEILPSGSPTEESYAAGDPSSVAHAFEVTLLYEYSKSDQYSGSTTEEFDNITEALSPKGVLPELRATSTQTISGHPVTYRDPTERDIDIVPFVTQGGTFARVHMLTFEITLVEPS